MGWLYVPGLAASSWESSSPSVSATVAWATSSGKPLPRPLSWRGWGTRVWIQRLSGMMLQPSTADRGVAAWISSLPASRVNRGALPANEAESLMIAGSGPPSPASFARYDPASCSWKMSQLSLLVEDSPTSSLTLPPSGSMRSGVLSARMGLVRATSVTDSGSSRWPTPKSNDAEKRGNISNESRSGLSAKAQHSPTPTATAGGYNQSPSAGAAVRPTLATLGRQWPTPTARDWKGSAAAVERDGVEQFDQLDRAIRGWTHSLPSRILSLIGPGCSSECQRSRRQSASFTEWLMGWPIGWTASAPLAGEWSRWRQLMRTEFSRLGWG